MGRAGARRPHALRVPRARGRAGGPVVVDDPQQARRLSPRFADFDPGRSRGSRRRGSPRSCSIPGIVRNRLKVECAVSNARAFLKLQRRARLVRRVPVELRRRQADRQPAGREAADPAALEAVGRRRRRAQAARLQVRRLDDHVRAHAGVRARQRSPDRVPALARCPGLEHRFGDDGPVVVRVTRGDRARPCIAAIAGSRRSAMPA